MPSLLALSVFLVAQADALRLPIGRTGDVTAAPDTIVDLASGTRSSIDKMLNAASHSRFVYVGESHDSLRHLDMQAAVIDGLAKRGCDVIVGLEMFTRPLQGQLNPWTLGWWTEEQFVERSDWKKQWGFEYRLYKPVFDAVRRTKARMVALNVPRDWVRAVGRGGWDALTPEQKAQVPAWTPPHPRHNEIFNAMIGGHPMSGDAAKNMYAAQCLWDIGMADSAVKYMKTAYISRKTVFVVLAGSGHILYDAAIPYRIAEYMGAQPKTTIICVDSAEPVKVSRGVGDFLYVAPAPPAKSVQP